MKKLAFFLTKKRETKNKFFQKTRKKRFLMGIKPILSQLIA